jgi:hypothetical protein
VGKMDLQKSLKIVESKADLGYNAFDSLFSLLEEWLINSMTFENR